MLFWDTRFGKLGRRVMNELQRHRLAFKVIRPVAWVLMKTLFNYEYDDLSKIEGPYLLLVNHNLELDPAAVGVAAGNQLYFVASEHILRKGFGTWFLMNFFRPIIHMKGRQGINTVKQMLKTLREHSVCIFPEGNRSFNGLTGEIQPSIAKVARRSGAKLLTYRIEGGYLSQPRWSLSLRKGRLRGRLIHEYSREELKGMTDQEVNDAICADLFEDAYATQKQERIAFRGKNLALGMESTLFTCPDCGRMGTLHSEGDRLYCECGFSAVYDVYGELTDQQGRTYTVTELDAMQQEQLKAKLEEYSEDEPLFSDTVTWYEINGQHEVTGTEEGVLTAYKDRLTFKEKTVKYTDLQGMAIYSRNFVILHMEGMDGHVELKADKMFCALKYLYLYELERNQV